MRRFLLGFMILSLAFALGSSWPTVSAQQPGGEDERQYAPDKERQLSALIAEALYASRAPDIYADLRRTLRELYLPYFRDFLDRENGPAPDPEIAERITLLVPAIEYSLKAADELDPVLEENRDAMIGDAASLLAKYMTRDEIRITGEMLNTPAARKGFNVLYAMSRLMTGYNHEDMRASQDMSEWMRGLDLGSKRNPFLDKNAPPPPRERVAKAEAVVADFMRVSRVDDMVGDIVSFANDVLLNDETLKDDEREQIRDAARQFEFFYDLGKSMSVAVAPSALASSLDDEQLNQFHMMIISPVMAKGFGLLYDVVRQATSFTTQDIREFRQLAEEAQARKSLKSPEVERLMEEEWEALVEKWRAELWSSLSPETQAGLEGSFAALRGLAEEERRKYEGSPGWNAPPPGQRDL